MKKLKKLQQSLSRKEKPAEVNQRITNETVAEHREKILSGGRKFKYPVQYARHRLVINTIFISLGAIVLLVGITWWQLYPAQNSGSFFYRLTQIVPLPVASIDGQNVPYRDYLMEYRSSIHWLEHKSRGFDISSNDGKRQSEHIKRQSLDSAIRAAYAQKIADKVETDVSDREIDDFILKTLDKGDRKLSLKARKSVLSDSFGVSESEYRIIVRSALLKKKISFQIDDAAKKRANSALADLEKGMTFEEAVAKYSDDPFAKASLGDVGFVPKTNRDQGLVGAALSLKKDGVSQLIKGTNAYYIIKLTDSNDQNVRYSRIRIELKEFNSQINKLRKDDKISEYISVKK